MHEAGLGASFSADHDQKEVSFIDIGQREAGNGVSSRALLHRNGGVVGQVCHHLAGVVDELVDLGTLGFQHRVELRQLSLAESVILHQSVHVKAVAKLCGDASCRGVGLLQITKCLQLCHFVADGGGGQDELLALGQCL